MYTLDMITIFVFILKKLASELYTTSIKSQDYVHGKRENKLAKSKHYLRRENKADKE